MKDDSRISLRLHPLDLFFLIRPPMLIPVWTFFLAGYWRSENIAICAILGFIKDSLLLKSHFWCSFIAYSLLLGSIYIINQIVDRESDRLNKKLFLIPLGIVSLRLAYILLTVLIIISFFIIFKYGAVYLIFFLLSLIIGLFYSIPPLRFKGKPLIDIFSNAFGYGVLAFGVGWLTAQNFSLRLLLYSIPYFFATASVFTTSTILDIEGDRRDRSITTAVKFGKSASLIIAIFTLSFALISAIMLRDLLIIITSLISFPLLIKALTGKKREFITLYMRGGSYILIILIGILFPWYFVLLLFVYFISKYYYKFRFGIDYPEIMEKEEMS